MCPIHSRQLPPSLSYRKVVTRWILHAMRFIRMPYISLLLRSPRKELGEEIGKKAVALARATHYDDVNMKLKPCDSERFHHRLAKVLHLQTEDVEKFFGINDENDHLLMDRKMTLNRWRIYFENLDDRVLPSRHSLCSTCIRSRPENHC